MKKILFAVGIILAPLLVRAQEGTKIEGDPPHQLDRAISVWARDRVNANFNAIFGEVDGMRSGDTVFTEITTSGDITISGSFPGLLGTKITNTFSGPVSVAGAVHQMTNDQGYWGLIGMTNSGSSIFGGTFANTFQNYNIGYGPTLFTIDGNQSFLWFADTTDSHNFTALSDTIMELKPDGGLVTDSISTSAIYYADTYWDDLRVPVDATTVNGSNPPTDALFVNDGNEIPGTAYALSFLSTQFGNLNLPDNVAFNTSADFTFNFWLRPVVGTENNIECMRKQGVFEVDYTGADQLTLSVTGIGSSQSSVAFNRGAWNMITVSQDLSESEIYLYINDILALTINGTMADNTNNFVYNRQETLYDVDYVEYWDVLLTGATLSARYASGAGAQLIGNEVGLKGLWELNDGSGTTVVEKTGIPGNGTISGGTEGVHWEWIGGHVGNTSPGSRGVILQYFSPDIVNELNFKAQVPHWYAEGTDFEVHVHSVPNADGTGSADIKWKMEYSIANIGEVFTVTDTLSGWTNHLNETLVKNKHYIYELGTIDGTNVKISAMLSCRIFRDATNSLDDFNDFAGLLEIDFHMQKNSPGSREEYEK